MNSVLLLDCGHWKLNSERENKRIVAGVTEHFCSWCNRRVERLDVVRVSAHRARIMEKLS